MHTPVSPTLQSRFRSFTNRPSHRNLAPGFFQTHPVGEVIRSLFLSSLMWVLLAGTVYTVYSMVVNAHTDEKADQLPAHHGF